MKSLLAQFPVLIICLVLNSTNLTAQKSNASISPIYYPPISGDHWEKTSVAKLSWNQSAVQPLNEFLALKRTKGFIILKDGKIVIEEYFNGHSRQANWYWASAGKSLTSTIVGIAAQENLLDINESVSKYLGDSWTNMPVDKEKNIKVINLLNMTSGIDERTASAGILPEHLIYKADAGTEWDYNSVFIKLQDVVSRVCPMSFEDYFNSRLKNKIGIGGRFLQVKSNTVYFSNTRSMARFGLLMLTSGKWENEVVLNKKYFDAATNPSQSLNQSYGYLWWLNGKKSYRLPRSEKTFDGSLIPSAPDDMIMALGKNDQKIYIVPSKGLVIVRMGESADNLNFALSDFDNELWQKINNLLN